MKNLKEMMLHLSIQNLALENAISWSSDHAQVLSSGYIKINEFVPTTQVEYELKTTGPRSIRLSDVAYVDGDMEAGDFYRNVGLRLADALVGIDVVTGVARDTYETVTGKNLITGEELDDFSRDFDVFGVVTFGLGSKIGKGVPLLNKICKDERLIENAGKIAEKFDVITRLGFENRFGREKLKSFAKTTKNWDALAWNTYPKV